MKTNLLDYTTELNEQLVPVRFVTHNITTESMPLFLKNISSLFVNKLQSFIGIFSTNSSRIDADKVYSDYNQFVKDLMANQVKAKTVASKIQYSEVAKLIVPTVVGLSPNKTLVDLAENVAPALDIVKQEVMSCLLEIDQFLANVLTDTQFRIANQPFKPNMKIQKLEDDLYKRMGKVISSKSIEDTKPLHVVIPNLSSLSTVIDKLSSSARGITLEYMKDLEKNIDYIMDKVKNLEEDMRKPTFEINKNLLKKLSTDLEYGAKLVTVSISYIHLFNQTAIITKNIIDILHDKKPK